MPLRRGDQARVLDGRWAYLEVVVPVGQLVEAVLQGTHARHPEGDDEERGDRLVPVDSCGAGASGGRIIVVHIFR
jgi:hypothetical protein